MLSFEELDQLFSRGLLLVELFTEARVGVLDEVEERVFVGERRPGSLDRWHVSVPVLAVAGRRIVTCLGSLQLEPLGDFLSGEFSKRHPGAIVVYWRGEEVSWKNVMDQSIATYRTQRPAPVTCVFLVSHKQQHRDFPSRNSRDHFL